MSIWKILFAMKFFVCFPMIFGGVPFMFFCSLVVSAILGYVGFRFRSIGHQKLAWSRACFVASAYIGVLPILGFIGMRAHRAWVMDLRASACGVKVGMSKEDARAMVSRCSTGVRESSEGFTFRPPGLAVLHPLDMGVYGVLIAYDAKGNVSQVNGWSD